MNDETSTPRTDAASWGPEQFRGPCVPVPFAQQLERELASATAELEYVKQDYRLLSSQLDGHDAAECSLNLGNLKRELTEAREKLKEVEEIAANRGDDLEMILEFTEGSRAVSSTERVRLLVADNATLKARVERLETGIRTALNDYGKIIWGRDGDAGANRVMERLDDVLEQALASREDSVNYR